MNPANAPALEPQPGVGGGLAGMANVFIDPATTAKNVRAPYAWLWPALLLAAGFAVIVTMMIPYSTQLGEAALAQRNMPPEQLEQARKMTGIITQVSVFLAPCFVLLGVALYALLIKVVYSMMDIRPKFRDLFALLACCELIIMIQSFAAYFVIKSKADPITSQEQLTPPFGLDILFPNLHGTGLAFLNFFSLFEIWFMVVLFFGLVALTRSSKTKALIAMTPAWLVPLAFRLIGSLFVKPPA